MKAHAEAKKRHCFQVALYGACVCWKEKQNKKKDNRHGQE